jgi:4-hydroxy-tetrahydrodipicolinate synthase
MSSSSSPYRGAYTALVTPFRNDKVDEKAFAQLLEEQVAAGIDGVIPVGTTGESATLTTEEHLEVIELAIKIIKGRIKVIAGTGSNNTTEAIYYTKEAEKLGADGVLIVAPYYNKPTQAGVFAHYAKLAESTKLPIVTYSIPGRCGIEIAIDTMVNLAAKFSNIVAIKESGGSIERFSQLRQVLPDNVSILSGDDSMTLPALAVGATGVVSVATNLIPKEVGDMVRAFLAGRGAEAEKIHRRLYPLFRDLFIESNPVPTKVAIARKGWMTEEVRLPLVPIQAANRAKLEATLKSLGL